jgi:hypothetical protein
LGFLETILFLGFFVTLFAKNSGKPRLSYTLAGNFTRRGVGKITGGGVGQIGVALTPP